MVAAPWGLKREEINLENGPILLNKNQLLGAE